MNNVLMHIHIHTHICTGKNNMAAQDGWFYEMKEEELLAWADANPDRVNEPNDS